MNCVIIAAGQGKRLSTAGVPKPLLPLLGLTLIERTILTAEQAGIREFYVVTGYRGEEVGAFVSRLALRRNIEIHIVPNQEWQQKENGTSVLKAEPFLDEAFVLLMSDHLFEEATLRDLLKEPVPADELVLAVDFNTSDNKLIDMQDVTKVLAKGIRIDDIGKNIKEYNAFDTGMFLCPPDLFRVLEKNCREGDSSLSGAVRAYAAAGKARVFDIKKGSWMDIDTEADRKNAKKLLLGTLAKPHDGWISKTINRKFSTRFFTPLLLFLFHNITPNIVSIISAFTGIVASLFFFFHQAVIGGILIQLASILDGSDGEIARLKKMQSPFGNFLDAVLDRYTDFFILFGMFYYCLTSHEINQLLAYFSGPAIVLISTLAIVGNIMVSYTSTKSATDFHYRYQGKLIAAGKGRDFRLFLLFIGGVMAFVHPLSVLIALLLVAVISNAIVLLRVLLSQAFNKKKNSLIKRRKKAIIFDFDGTLADTMTFLSDVASNLLVKNYNLSEEEARKKYLESSGLEFAAQVDIMFPNDPKNSKVVSAFEKLKRESILDHRLFPDVKPALSNLKAKRISLFVCSSTLHELLIEHLKSKDVHEMFDGYFGLREGFQKARQIDFILEHFDFQPDEVLFIGDSLTDCGLAKKKGIEFVGLSRIFKKSDFKSRGALAVDDLVAFTRLWDESEKYQKHLQMI